MMKEPKQMPLEKALDLVKAVYADAVERNQDAENRGYGPVVYNPVAWALYKVWLVADGKEKFDGGKEVILPKIRIEEVRG